MVNRTFKGRRLEWLLEQKPLYDEAVTKSTVPSFLDVVFARFCRRFPIDMPLEQEPSAESVAAVDDDAAEPEPESLGDDLSEEEMAAAIEARRVRQALIRKRKKQVKNWFHYQYMKDNNHDPKSSNDNNPFGAVIAALTGQELFPRPRLKTAVNTWCKTEVIEINKVVQQTVIAERTPPGKTVAVWNRVAKQLFNLLKPEEKQEWERKAKENHEAALAEWKASKDKRISTTPQARQKCIEGLVRFGQPIIEAMALATGFKVTLIAGGPEPADGGRLNVISLHAGTTNGDVKLNFGQKMRTQYLEQVLPTFSEFLKACYTTEECRARALSPQAQGDLDALEDMALADMGATLDAARFKPSVPYIPAASPNGDAAALDVTALPTPPTATVALNPTTASSAAALNPMDVGTSTTADVPRELPASSAAVQGGALASPARSLPPTPLPSPAHSRAASPIAEAEPVVPLPPPIRSPTRRAASLGSLGTPRSPLNTRTDVNPIASRHDGTSAAGDGSPSPPKSLTVDASANDVPAVNANYSDAPPDSPATRSGRRSKPAAAPQQVNKRRRKAPLPSPPPKRPRLTAAAPSTVSTSSTIATVSTADLREQYGWFNNAIVLMTDESLGEQWLKLVAAWVAFEAKHQCRRNGQLSAKGRPVPVGDWINRGRSVTWRPSIKDSKAYGDDHILWWSSLQPEWRIVDDDFDTDNTELGLAREDDGDFKCLEVSGANGLLSVLASLFFWGLTVKSAGKKSKRWNECIDDLMYVLTRLSA